ncbi:MAG: DUF434 domain-containing protein [Acidobacteriota bacterium]
MPDTRRHRGSHPKDAGEFSERQLPTLRDATGDLAWLLERGYPVKRSTVLVGDRYALRERQRKAVGRAAASGSQVAGRRSREMEPAELAGRDLWIDGYNVLLTVEAALGGGVLLDSMDGTLRDIAAMSSHYKRVDETEKALELLGAALAEMAPVRVHWLLDRPISNSGRLRALMLAAAERRGWPWRVELVANPDAPLKRCTDPVVTADSAILDAGPPWLNLARRVVDASVPGAWRVDLGGVVPLGPEVVETPGARPRGQ